MKAFRLRLMSQALPFLLMVPGIAYAQQINAPSSAEAAAAATPGAAVTYSSAQLDQMLAPIALYPDQLLMQVLMAATFPQQVIDAGQWLQDSSNAALHGDALVSALEPLPWDPSVKSVVAFPQIIVMMNTHMDWTQSLGVAFGGQQVATMARVQFLRGRAAAAGQFHTNAQIKYVHEGPDWVIEPVNPGMIYVPVYNPAVVYGAWPDREYPPVYVPPPPQFVAAGFNLGPGIGFSVGFGVVAPLWGWGHPDWRRHEVVVDQTRYGRITQTDRFTENHITIQNNTWHRTAPVVTIVAPSRAAPNNNGPHPPGTATPAAIHAPPPSPGARPSATPAQTAPNTATPSTNEPTRTAPTGTHPAEPAKPGPATTPPTGAHPAEPAKPGPTTTAPTGTHPPEPSRPAEPAHPAEPPRPTPQATHPAEPAHPVEPPHPTPEATHPAEPVHPAEPPHPMPQATHPAEPVHPAEPPHPAPPAPAAHPPEPPHPTPAPPQAHPAPPPQQGKPTPAKPEEKKEEAPK